MKKKLLFLMTITLLLTLSFAVFGCAGGNVNYKTYDPTKYKESIDLTGYDLVFEDEFSGELDRSIWGDTRQGTRRDGYWTKNLAYTDNEGHLILRTEKRGSRYCSDTAERSVVGYNGSRVSLTYDDCYPFGVIAGDFGDAAALHSHTDDLVGNVILAKFNELGIKFDAYQNATVADRQNAYASFFSAAMELYGYYAFVQAVKTVDTPLANSAVIGLNYDFAAVFGDTTYQQELRAALAHLYGFDDETTLSLSSEMLANACENCRLGANNEAIENGGFLTACGDFIFPIAIRNESTILVTFLIADEEGKVSVWVNDVAAMLRMTNHDQEHYSSATVNNEVFCKNVLFVTGPEGVYSGAVRTLGQYTHGFGYYEIRCKLPDTEGMWHAFWMMCGDVYSVENGSTDGIEIDVFEYLPARDAINCALHWDGYDEAHQNAHQRFENVGCADGEFHTFGMNWDESGYTFYIDGKKVWTSTGDGICKQEGYLKISTEYGEWGNWVGTLDPDFQGVDWVIDYVRIYDKK